MVNILVDIMQKENIGAECELVIFPSRWVIAAARRVSTRVQGA